MLAFQQRVREILLGHPWFQSPVKIHIEDRKGIAEIFSLRVDKLAWPVVHIRTAQGAADNRALGLYQEQCQLSIQLIEQPLTNRTGRLVAEGVEAAIHVLHEAILWPGDGQPGRPRIHVLGHGPVDGAPGEHAHEVRIHAPLQIRPATPAGQA